MSTASAFGGKRRYGRAGRPPKTPPYDTDAWATPQKLFDELNREFRFTLDVCASPENAKCDYFYSRETDGLSKAWAEEYAALEAGAKPVCWMNPPYSQVAQWLEKAHAEAQRGVTTVALVKADTSTIWFRRFYPLASEVRFLKRIQFIPPPGYDRKVGSPNMGHAVLVFRGKR